MSEQVFMLSGLLCDDTVWQGFSHRLESRAQVSLVDFCGFDDLTTMAESVLDVAPKSFALVGHSMGARVALEIYRKAPDRVERLALLDTGVHPRKPNETETRQRLIDLAFNEGMGALAEAWLPPMVHPSFAKNREAMRPLVDMVKRMTPEIYAAQVKALLNRPDASSLLSEIRCPTLVGVGKDDVWSPYEQHVSIAQQITGAVLVPFQESGHMAPFETPFQVEAAIKNWLDS